MKYIIDQIPPSNNRFIGRKNHWEYQRIKCNWHRLIAVKCLPKPAKTPNKAVVTLTYYFPDHRRRDPDNYSGKMILDGLTRVGIIKDDSFHCIDLVLKAKYDKQYPRTEIEIQGEDNG